GKMLDPLADKILVITVLIGLVGLGKANSVAVMLIVTREFLVASFRGKKNFAASPIAKWKTFTQVLATVMLMLNIAFADGILWLAVILSLISGGAYLWQSPLIKSLRLN
ncbi:MAG: CDP-alcohol phosphatidyltransferase family protein, partial [Candidatus Margulisiibacteriota bacterium]